MRDYLSNIVGRTLWSGMLLVGFPVAIAWLLQRISPRLWSIGVLRGKFGNRRGGTFLYATAIGVACHELGHAVGTWITGNRVVEFVPFRPDSEEHPDYLGWVRHTLGSGVWGKISQMIICTGPIWFGSIVMLLLTRFLVGQEMNISYYDYFTNGELPGLFAYLVACLRCAILLCCDLAGGALFSGWKMFLWAYLVFCIAPHLRMSGPDLDYSKSGFVLVLAITLAFLLLPISGRWIAVGVALLLPKFFIVHVLMILAVFINTGFLFLEKFIVRMP